MNDERKDNIEVRLNKDGSVDEIVVYDTNTDKCLFHLEQMDDHYYWMRAYGITQDLVVYIGATIGKVRGDPIPGDPVQEGKVYPEGVMYNGGKAVEIKGWQEFDGGIVFSNFEWEDGHHEDEHTHKDYRTPEADRLGQVKNIVEKFGIDQILNDLMVVYGQGRREPHDLTLINEVQQARVKYAEAEKAAWDKKMAEFKKLLENKECS